MTLRRRHKVIYFDLDGTLVDYESDACHAYGKAREHALESYPDAADLLTDEMFKRARDAIYMQFGDIGIPLKDWYRECMRTALQSADIFDSELAGRMGELYALFRNTTIQVFDDALEVVPKLAKAYRLGLLTNGSTMLQQLPIEDFFVHSIYARDVGHEKPSSEIFYAAAKVAGCSKREMIRVGDGQHTDILGARNAGVEMVWINRERVDLLSGIPRPDHEIHDLREIFEITTV